MSGFEDFVDTDKMISLALKLGWKLSSVEIEGDTVYMLSNSGDKVAMGWAAMWIKVLYKNKVVNVPHWLPDRLIELTNFIKGE